jgi:hypothetical protein
MALSGEGSMPVLRITPRKGAAKRRKAPENRAPGGVRKRLKKYFTPPCGTMASGKRKIRRNSALSRAGGNSET